MQLLKIQEIDEPKHSKNYRMPVANGERPSAHGGASLHIFYTNLLKGTRYTASCLFIGRSDIILYIYLFFMYLFIIFSSPEPKAQGELL